MPTNSCHCSRCKQLRNQIVASIEGVWAIQGDTTVLYDNAHERATSTQYRAIEYGAWYFLCAECGHNIRKAGLRGFLFIVGAISLEIFFIFLFTCTNMRRYDDDDFIALSITGLTVFTFVGGLAYWLDFYPFDEQLRNIIKKDCRSKCDASGNKYIFFEIDQWNMLKHFSDKPI